MPVIENTKYNHPRLMFNGHLQTIFPAVFRNPGRLMFDRERISTEDGDFLDLDWLRIGSDHLVIISHGLEGNSRRPYMKGMAKVFSENGFDVLNWNFRGCSGEMNRLPVFYHSGATQDLDAVVGHAAATYKDISLIGFSLGGNLTLKYIGETRRQNHQKIRRAVGISVPLDLGPSCDLLSKKENKLYSQNFLSSLKQKIRNKALVFPDKMDLTALSGIKTLRQFDDLYTAPLHGFLDAEDYYGQCAALKYLPNIKMPTLILNAANDPFLSNSCYPTDLGMQLETLYLEFPKHGGHVGFSPRSPKDRYWSEKRSLEFIQTENYP